MNLNDYDFMAETHRINTSVNLSLRKLQMESRVSFCYTWMQTVTDSLDYVSLPQHKHTNLQHKHQLLGREKPSPSSQSDSVARATLSLSLPSFHQSALFIPLPCHIARLRSRLI